MPIYSSKAGQLINEFETALLEQKQALANLAASLKSGAFADMAAAADLIEFHNDRVNRLNEALQPYRLDKG
jgi:hypothetical protein